MRYDVILTVPHGGPGNDRGARPVASQLAKVLDADSWSVLQAVNARPRRLSDMNRSGARKKAFRRAVADAVAGGCGMLIDVHSFEPDSRRFAGKDVVLLHTPGLQDEGFYASYADCLRRDAEALGRPIDVRVEPAKYEDDVCIQAAELGQRPDSMLLAEHDSGGPLGLYALLHALAINRFLLDRR